MPLFDQSKIPKMSEPKLRPIDLLSVTLTKTTLMELIERDLSYDDKVSLIEKSHYLILEEIVKNHNIKIFDFLISNPENIDILANVISSNPYNLDERNYCNKIIYDFLESIKNDSGNINHKSSYLHLAKAVNRNTVSKLSIIVPEDLALMMCVCRYSSTNETVNTNRLLNLIICQDEKLITEQKMIDIFIALYDRISPLFIGVMSFVKDRSKLSESQESLYALIDLVMLDILNEMPTDQIRKVLVDYATNIQFGYIKEPKFSLRPISDDFSRIIWVIDALEKNESIYIL